MKLRTRIKYTDSHKALMGYRWRQGESLHQIARLFDRHHSSVRGVHAETGGMLLRQYFPKGVDLSSFSQAKLNSVARQLSERPRKTLDFQTPIERYQQAVALTS